ncbi:MAG: DUF5715 family protein [Acidobacteriaceae bacterium]
MQTAFSHFVKNKIQYATCILLLMVVGACAPAFGMHRRMHARHVHRGFRARLRHIFWNPLFRPSHESLLRQNEEIDRLDLPRIQDDDELERLKSSEDLVPIVPSLTLRIDPRLDPDRRYCRPFTRDFLEDISEAYYRQFHQQIQVNSAVRTVLVQKKLRRHNRNAAPEFGDTASSHLAGITVDLQRRGMSRAQVKWMEQYIVPLKAEGLVEPEEERHQWVFHIAVSGRYSEWRESQMLANQTELEQDTDSDAITLSSNRAAQ